MKCAVYGTLKRGYHNNGLLENATFLKEDVIDGYLLWDCGFPYAIAADGCAFTCELFEVSLHDVEKGLDWLEGYRGQGYEGNHYDRIIVTTRSGEEVSVYVRNPRRGAPMYDVNHSPHVVEADGTKLYTWSRSWT